MIDKTNTELPLFEIVVKDLKEKIFQKHFGEQGKLPNYVELAETYDVSMSTIKRTMKILNDEGFLVSRVGKGTFVNKSIIQSQFKKQEPTNKLAFSIINENDANFFDVQKEIEELASDLGKELIVNVSDSVNEHEESILEMLNNHSVDGLILGTSRKSIYGVELYDRIKKEIPAFFCHEIYDSVVPIVTIDNYKVGKIAAKELMKKSKKNLCLILDENGYKSDDLKLKGFTDEVQRTSSSNRCVVVRNSFKNRGATYDDGRRFGKILDLNSLEIDAVFASNDEVARGFQDSITEKGYKIPIIGFGNIKFEQKPKYAFKTIGLNPSEFGKVLLNYFQAMFENNGYGIPSKILIEPKLITK